MSPYLLTRSGSLDIEDAAVLEVRRLGAALEVLLDRVWFTAVDADGEGHKRLIEHLTLRLEECTERATKFVTDSETAPPDDTRIPIDQIEVVEYGDGNLTLSGYRHRVPWVVWELRAHRILVSAHSWEDVAC